MVCLLCTAICNAQQAASLSNSEWSITERKHTFPTRGDRPVEVINHFGRIEMKKTSDRRDIGIFETAQAHPEDPSQPTFSIEHGDTTRISVHWAEPADQGALPPDALRKRRCDIGLFVPSSLPVKLETNDGDIRAKGLESDIQARSRKGNITISSKGNVNASNGEGSVWVVLKPGGKRHGTQAISTESGMITLRLPPDERPITTAVTRGLVASDYSTCMDVQQDLKTARIGSRWSWNPFTLFGALRTPERINLTSGHGQIRILRPVPAWSKP